MQIIDRRAAILEVGMERNSYTQINTKNKRLWQSLVLIFTLEKFGPI